MLFYHHYYSTSCSTNVKKHDVIRCFAHAQWIYFLACSATSHLDSCKLAQIYTRQRNLVKRLSEKEFKVTEGAKRDCGTKLHALFDIYGSMELKGTPSPCLFKLFVSSQGRD